MSGPSLVSQWQLQCYILMSWIDRIQNGSNEPLYFTLRPKKRQERRTFLTGGIFQKRHDLVTSKMKYLRRHCSVWPLSHPISLGPTFSNFLLSYASIDVLWSHFSGSKPYFATIFKRVIFFEQPCMTHNKKFILSLLSNKSNLMSIT